MTEPADEFSQATHLYAAIAQRLRAATPPAAQVVHLYAAISEPDNGLFVLRHELPGDATLHHAGQRALPPDILDLCVALRELMHRPGQRPWTQAHFTLDSTGELHVSFGYPDAPIPQLP